jgi:PPOX class probable F420-dependent enzyme
MGITIPESHRDLLAEAVNVVLTTIMPDGQPQTTPVWCNLEGDYVLINTMQQFQKGRNIQRNPRVGLLAYRLKQPLRNIEVRGKVIEITEEGALEHLNELNMMYSGKPNFFGDSVPEEFIHKFTPLKVRIEPIRVRVEG